MIKIDLVNNLNIIKKNNLNPLLKVLFRHFLSFLAFKSPE